MNEDQTTGYTGLLSQGIESGIKKAGENVVNRALNSLIDGVKKKYNEAQVLLGNAFTRYLHNASMRYNQVRTLATGTSPRTIIGDRNVYVSIGVRHGQTTIETDTVEPMLEISNNILIIGTGGIGKSMLMRYLFLNTANRGEYVPVLLELRKISNQAIGQISILNLIYSCMEDFDVKLPKEQFEYSLRLGKYLFLLDGFDEVKENLAAEAAAAIQAFCAKYPKNPCIITSRPRRDTSPLETFTAVESMALSKKQAILLASKIWKEDDKTREFCRQLDESLYENHKDFAENPLLLSMMFLTFMRNNSVPNHLAEFYSKAYDALYSAHDSNDKGFYQREFRCKYLDEPGFRLLLSHFCFQSYFKEHYEFTRDTLLSYLEKSIQKLGFKNVCPADYLEDLRNVVCILTEDGDVYRFSHRSFQAYFAACYTSSILTDEQQKMLFESRLSGVESYWGKEDYYELLSQIEPHRFAVNALEDALRTIQKKANKDPNPDTLLLKLQFRSIYITKDDSEKEQIGFFIGSQEGEMLHFNVIELFDNFVHKLAMKNAEELEPFRMYILSFIDRFYPEDKNCNGIPFSQIDSLESCEEKERQSFYEALARVQFIPETRAAIANWLSDLDKMRETLATPDFIDDL